jgi:hypothetical protein
MAQQHSYSSYSSSTAFCFGAHLAERRLAALVVALVLLALLVLSLALLRRATLQPQVELDRRGRAHMLLRQRPVGTKRPAANDEPLLLGGDALPRRNRLSQIKRGGRGAAQTREKHTERRQAKVTVLFQTQPPRLCVRLSGRGKKEEYRVPVRELDGAAAALPAVVDLDWRHRV